MDLLLHRYSFLCVVYYVLLQLTVWSKDGADYRGICADRLLSCRYILSDNKRESTTITSFELIVQLLDKEYNEQNLIIEIKVYDFLSLQQMVSLDNYLAER